jgi:membrane protease YdiL (CAAX protease family)
LRFSCQYCGSDIAARATRAGELASCSLCGIENVIPEGIFHRLRIRGLLLWGFVSAFVLGAINIALKSPDSDFKYIWLLWFHGLILVWSFWKIKRLRLNTRRIIGRVPKGHRWLKTAGIVVPLMLFAIGSGGLYVQFLSWISPSFAEDWFEAEEISKFHIFFLIILVPPIEELFFRGVLIHRWAEKWDIKRAVFASTIVFATLHKNMIGALAYGFVLSVLYIRTRTLIVPVVCHILINVLAVSISAAGSKLDLAASELLFSLLCLILSIPWLIYFMRKNWPERSWNTPYFANKDST